MLKEVALATSLAAAAVPLPAAAKEVRVGILDMAADSVPYRDRATSIEYREFTPEGQRSGRWGTRTQLDHGVAVASAFVDQVRRMDRDAPIRIFAANPMVQAENGIRINFDSAVRALDWFKENDVKVVMTTMVGRDSEGMRRVMREAETRGLTVMASAGNDPTPDRRAFPAAYPEAVSIAGDAPSLLLRKDPSVAGWVNFAMDGRFEHHGFDGVATDEGSSFAVARASAVASYAVATGRAHDRDGIRTALGAAATPRALRVEGVSVTVSYIDRDDAGERIRALAPVQAVARGGEDRVPVAQAPSPAALGARQASLANGY